MKVLVADVAGYIGSVTTEMLCNEGHDTASVWTDGTRPGTGPKDGRQGTRCMSCLISEHSDWIFSVRSNRGRNRSGVHCHPVRRSFRTIRAKSEAHDNMSHFCLKNLQVFVADGLNKAENRFASN
jgi:nucleoside-diphosphate-sugar epimerase